MEQRWLRWTLGVVAVLALYAIAGFWGVPALLRWQLPRLAAEKLERPASVGPVRFNPFTLRLQARDLRLDEADGSPLLAVAALEADLEWRSLVDRAWTLRQVRIEAPRATLAVARDGGFNLAALLDTLQRHSDPKKKRTGEIPRVVVGGFALTAGRIEWDDRQVDTQAVVEPVELRFDRLSTLPNDRDAWRLAADIAGGGRVRWTGEASLDPIRARGELVVEELPLPTLGAYLKPHVRAVIASGRLSATLPYEVAYDAGQLAARLHGAKLALADLAAGHAEGKARFASLREVQVLDVEADLAKRDAVIGTLRLAGGELGLQRDGQGRWDLAQLLVEREPPARPAPARPWKLAVRQLQVDALSLRVVDATATPPVTFTADRVGAQLRLDAAQTVDALGWRMDGGTLHAQQLALSQQGRAPVTLEQLAVEQASVDAATHRVEAGRIALEGGRLRVLRDAKGQIDLLAMLPVGTAGSSGSDEPATRPVAAKPPPWTARAAQVALSRTTIDVEDLGLGLRTQLQDVALRLDGVGSDLAQPVRIDGRLRLREGGELALQGRVVPGARTLDAQVQLRQLAVAMAQPVLARYLRLKLASGTLSTQGRLEASLGPGKPPVLEYRGRAEVANLRLDELDGQLFARWKLMAAEKVAVGTRGLEIPELRVQAPEASLIIENDRSFNAARLLVRDAAAAKEERRAPTGASGEAYPVRIQRVRLQDAKLEFVDLSLRPQFGARIHALGGVVTGLTNRGGTRSQVELEGRVDEYGLARVRGALNPFSPLDSTDLDVVFRNVDMVPASPYAMKFAGYRIAEGRISLDLRYRVRDRKLEGDNKIVIDNLRLGERVDSADALKLPLELAIAVLKDDEGRIDLGIPVTGDMADPQFSYGAVVWKAVSSVIARVATAPFRALAGLFGGGSGEKLEAVHFDPGSARLLPPEREQLQKLAQVLDKRAQLRLVVPAQFSEAADGAALRQRAVREDIVRRAGLNPAPGEALGPLDVGDSAIRAAVRALYTQRFGDKGWEDAKAAAETARPRGEASGAAAAPGAAASRLPAWRRISNAVQGEPQVDDAVGFYRGLVRRLEQQAPVDAGALAQLGAQRAQAVATALAQAGVDVSRITVGAPASVQSEPAQPVPLKLELAAR